MNSKSDKSQVSLLNFVYSYLNSKLIYMNTENDTAINAKKSNLLGTIFSYLIVGGLVYGAYIATTNFVATGNVFGDFPTLTMCDDVDKVENEMGLLETYKDGKPYSGYVIMAQYVMDSGKTLYGVMEYNEGGLLNGGALSTVHQDGQPVEQFNIQKAKMSACPF